MVYTDARGYSAYSMDAKVAVNEGGVVESLVEKGKMYIRSEDIIRSYMNYSYFEQRANYLVNNRVGYFYEWDVNEVVESLKGGSSFHHYLVVLGNSLFKGNAVTDRDISNYIEASRLHHVYDDIMDKDYIMIRDNLLTYNNDVNTASTADLLFRYWVPKLKDHRYGLYDWKFTHTPLHKKGNYAFGTYTHMNGIFKYLMDCDYLHSSIKLAFTQALCGLPDKIEEKVLLSVTGKVYEKLPAWPIEVFWEDNLDGTTSLHSVYLTYEGKWYDSRDNQKHRIKPEINRIF